MKTKKSNPLRTCIVCGGKYPKAELVRLVFDGSITADKTQTREGRGRYICANGCSLSQDDIKLLRRAFRNNNILADDIRKLLAELVEI